MRTIPIGLRDKHIYIAGKSGYGKSTMIHAQAYQDIKNGQGVCIIDPAGDLVNKLIHWIPENRVDDTIWLDCRNGVSIDFLNFSDEEEKEQLAGDIKYILMKDTDATHAPRMNAILTDLIYTLFAAKQSGNPTFLDLYHFLVNKKRRAELMRGLEQTNFDLWKRWNDEFPSPTEQAPIVSRMTPFVRNQSLTAMFGCPQPRLNIYEAMQSGKVILVDLPHSESGKIFGSLLVSKIQQAAFRRRFLPERERKHFMLYCDEFENFQTSSFDVILSQARKYKLCLTLANQALYQLDSNIRDAIFGNVSTFIAFHLHDKDTIYFKSMAKPPFDPKLFTPSTKLPRYAVSHEELAQLPKFQAFYKVGDEFAVIDKTPDPPPYAKASYAEIIKKRTVDNYSCIVSQSLHNEVDGHSDTIEGGAEVQPPPHKGKKKRAGIA